MNKSVHEDIRIEREGIEEILRLHVETTESIDRSRTKVTFDVGSRSVGMGPSERDVTVFNSASVETVTPIASDDVLKVLGNRTFRFTADDVTRAISAYVCKARGVDRSAVLTRLDLQDRHQGDFGGYEGPSLTGAVATIKIY
jgi:hypothetical protein